MTQSDGSGSYPNQPYPGSSYPNQPYQPPESGQPTPYQPADPGQPTPYQPAPYQPTPYQPAPGQPTPYQPAQPGPAPYPGPAAPAPYPGPAAPAPYPGPDTPAYPNQPVTGQPYPSTQPTQAFPTQAYPSQVTPPPYQVSGTPATATPYSPYGYQQYPPPTPPKSKVLPALLIGGAVVVVLLVVVGVGALVINTARNKSGGTTLGPTTSSQPTAQSPTPSPTPAFTAFSGDLRTLLVPRPTGATKDSNTGNGNADGTVTLEQAAETYADPAFGKTHMQEFGFQQGATESWHESDKYSVQIVLFQFAKPDDTAEFVQKLEDGGDSDDFWDGRGDVDPIPNARYYVSAKVNKNGNYNFEIWFSKGGIAARMNAFGPDKTDIDRLKTLAQKQYALLP